MPLKINLGSGRWTRCSNGCSAGGRHLRVLEPESLRQRIADEAAVLALNHR